MLDFNPNKVNCSGCAACYSVCPVRCISMVQDEEGFSYPVSSDACINCHLCEKVCPIISPQSYTHYEKRAFAGISKDYQIWKRSASGGAFSEISRAWGDSQTLVVGAAWDGLKVHHIGILGVDNIAPICRSKYVASQIEDTFIEIKSHLQKNKKAIFCGTPCQVAGFRSFLRKDYENLLTIDLICHGVGSPLVFESCIEAISKQWGKKVSSYSFRAKRKAHEEDYLAFICDSRSVEYISKDQYIQLFLTQNCLRPSCGANCKFRNQNSRPGDITIADFKGLVEVFPDLKGYKRNYSTVVVNSHKGEAILSFLSKTMIMRECSVDDIIEYNPLFDRHTWFSKDRDAFFYDFDNDNNAAIAKWTKPYSKSKRSWKRIIYDELPQSLRALLDSFFASKK